MMIKNKSLLITLIVVVIFSSLLSSGCNNINPDQDLALIEAARDSLTLEGYQEYLDQAPKGEYVEEALIALAGFGHPFQNTPAYDKESKELVPMVIIDKYNPDRSIETVYAYRIHEWNDNLSENLKTETINDAVLFVIIEEVSEYYGSREYTGPYTLDGFILNANVEIREAKTGETIFSGVLEGSKPDFPYKIPNNTYFITGEHPSYESLESWINLRLTQPDEIISDPVLKEAIKLTLQNMGYSTGENLTVDDMQKLTYLKIVPESAKRYFADSYFEDGSVVIVKNSVSHLEGIQYAIYLTNLSLTFNIIKDISPLEELFSLERLIINNDTYINNTETIKILESQGCQIVRRSLPESYNNSESN